jgi:hypothetical protein
MRASELMAELGKMGVSYKGLAERVDLVKRLEEARRERGIVMEHEVTGVLYWGGGKDVAWAGGRDGGGGERGEESSGDPSSHDLDEIGLDGVFGSDYDGMDQRKKQVVGLMEVVLSISGGLAAPLGISVELRALKVLLRHAARYLVPAAAWNNRLPTPIHLHDTSERHRCACRSHRRLGRFALRHGGCICFSEWLGALGTCLLAHLCVVYLCVFLHQREREREGERVRERERERA